MTRPFPLTRVRPSLYIWKERLLWCAIGVLWASALFIATGCGGRADELVETGTLEQVYEGPEGWCCTEGDATECGMSEHVAFEWQRYRELSGREGECYSPDGAPVEPVTTCCELRNDRAEVLNRFCQRTPVAEAFLAARPGYRCWAVF